MMAILAAFLAWLAAAALLSAACGSLYVRFRRRLARIEPGQRADLVMAVSLMPVALSLAWVVLVFTPAVGDWVIDAHCHARSGCSAHAPLVAGRGIQLGSFLAACGGLSCAVVILSLRWRASLRRSRLMTRLAPRAGSGYGIADTDQLVAACVGWWRPRTIISTGLVRVATAGDLAVIVAHENMHARRKDNLRHLFAAATTMLIPATWRKTLLGDLRTSAEQACDAAAAIQVGDRLQVAHTVLKFARLALPSPGLRACGFGESQAVARVCALLRPAEDRLGARHWMVGSLVLCVGAVAGAAPLHHIIETLLRWLS